MLPSVYKSEIVREVAVVRCEPVNCRNACYQLLTFVTLATSLSANSRFVALLNMI